jgi:hypothetical protein
MKMYGGMDVQIHIHLTSALVGDERSVSTPSCFTYACTFLENYTSVIRNPNNIVFNPTSIFDSENYTSIIRIPNNTVFTPTFIFHSLSHYLFHEAIRTVTPLLMNFSYNILLWFRVETDNYVWFKILNNS